MLTFIVGIVDTPNKNGRTYPRAVMEKAIADYKKPIDQKRSVGELNPQYDSPINLTSVSHIVTDLRIEENNLIADVDVLTTPKGIVLQTVLDSQHNIEFVTRGLAKIDEEKNITEYTLISVDACIAPPKLN